MTSVIIYEFNKGAVAGIKLPDDIPKANSIDTVLLSLQHAENETLMIGRVD